MLRAMADLACLPGVKASKVFACHAHMCMHVMRMCACTLCVCVCACVHKRMCGCVRVHDV